MSATTTRADQLREGIYHTVAGLSPDTQKSVFDYIDRVYQTSGIDALSDPQIKELYEFVTGDVLAVETRFGKRRDTRWLQRV